MSLFLKTLFFLSLTCCLALLAIAAPSLSTLIEVEPVPFPTDAENTETLGQLLASMRNHSDRYSQGVYAPGAFAFPIVQQPEDDNLYVSAKRNLVTAFGAAEKNGITGLLAHNFLAGAFFYDLEIGQEIWIVESEEKMQAYQVTDIDQFQKIDDDTSDVFIDLETQASMSGSQIFDRFYTGEPHLTLQTCLERDGDRSWGLTFIVAEPVVQ